jgi:hypothetical protein
MKNKMGGERKYRKFTFPFVHERNKNNKPNQAVPFSMMVKRDKKFML